MGILRLNTGMNYDIRKWIRLVEADIITEASNFRIGLTDVFRLVNRAQLLNLLKRYPVLRGWVGRDGITWVWNAGDLDHTSAQMEMPSSVNIAVVFRSKNAGEEELAQAEIADFDGEDQGEFSFHAACWEARDCYNFARLESPVLRRILGRR